MKIEPIYKYPSDANSGRNFWRIPILRGHVDLRGFRIRITVTNIVEFSCGYNKYKEILVPGFDKNCYINLKTDCGVPVTPRSQLRRKQRKPTQFNK